MSRRPLLVGLRLLLIGVGAELAVVAGFFSPTLVVALPLAVAGLALLAYLGARAGETRLDAFAGFAGWLVVSLAFSVPGPGGDLVLPGDTGSALYLVVSIVAGAAAAALLPRRRVPPRAPVGGGRVTSRVP